MRAPLFITIWVAIFTLPSEVFSQSANVTTASFSFSQGALNAGDAINLSGEITNNGTAATGGDVKINFFLSTSATQFRFDYILHSFFLSPLNAGETKSFSEVGEVPITANTRQYYVWISLDPDDTISESNENDNKTYASNNPLQVTSMPQPLIALSHTSLSFNATAGGSNPPDQTFDISNGGAGTLSWNASDNQSWLSLSPTSGSSTGEDDAVTASVDIGGLSAGTHNATITVSASGIANSPQTLSVTLNLNSAPVNANTFYVSPSGNDSNPGTINSPLRNIQTALISASKDDTIKVANGTYLEGLVPQTRVILLGGYTNTFTESERDIFVNRAVVEAVSTTMLTDLQGCTIDGFVFNGKNIAEKGLDIRSISTITHNIFIEIDKSPGYAIDISAAAIISNNTLYGNLTGIRVFSGQSGSSIVKNNIITNNQVGVQNSGSSGVLRYNDVFGNTFNYLGIYDFPGVGDISANPLYSNVATLDFRVTLASPTINAGDPADNVGDEPEPNGGRIDMGAYGGTKNATPVLPMPMPLSPADNAIGISTSPTLSWNTSQGATLYHLQVATTSNFSTTIVNDSTLTTTSHKIGPLNNNATYFWRVRAKNNTGGASAFSTAFRFTTAGDPSPAAPQNLLASPGDSQVTLTWDANSEPDFLRYRIFSDTSPSPTTQVDSVAGASTTSKKITGLTNGTRYYFRLKAIDQAGNQSGYSYEVDAIPMEGDVVPAPPTNLQAQAGDKQVHLTWNANSEGDFLRYRIYQSTSPGASTSADSLDGKANTSKTISGLTNGTTYYFRLRAVDLAMLESGYSNEVNATPEPVVVDTQPPLIIHTPIQVAAEQGQRFTISMRASDAGSGIQSVIMHYRRGGAAVFSQIQMNVSAGDNYEGMIPANAVTVSGLEYYLSVQDSAGNAATMPSSNPSSNPYIIQVTSDNLVFSRPTPSSAYRMISVPLDLNDQNVNAVLLDDLGNYDDTQWRFFRYKNGVNVEFSEFNALQDFFAPCIGYWLITRNSTTLDAGAGVSVPTGSNFTITLQPGWNQIGNPFAFPVNWSDVVRGASVENQLVGYQGSSNDASGYDITRTRLEPFEGYFVRNNSAAPVSIEIPPKSAIDGSAAPKTVSTLFCHTVLGNDEWFLQITASAENYLDKDNYIGSLHDAESEYDRNDLSEAPFFADFVSLYFPHHDWQDYPGLYTADFQPASDNSQTWDFQVKTNLDNTGVTLALAEVQNLPEGWDVRLLDRKSQIVLDLKQERNYTYLPTADETIRDFRIVVGKGEFVEESDLEITGVPQQFVLQQNYPNPFNPSTVIAFQLPENSRVELAIYAITGRLIRTLIAGEMPVGYHKITWDGRDGSGVRVPSGVYLVWMVAGEKIVAIRKMVLAK